MTPERHEEVGRIFHAALEFESSERDEFLNQACGGDSELRKEVEALFALDDPAKDFIEKQGWRFDLFATDELYVTDALADSVEIIVKFCPRCQRSYSRTQRYCTDDNHPLSLPDPYHLVGQTLADEYLIEALVGVGGMGAVYSAWHSRSDCRVAFKILQPNLSHNDHILRLFKREIKAAGRLNHENIAKIKDAGGTDGGLSYLVSEWLEGETLDEYLATSGPLSLPRTTEIIRQVAAALEAAHSRHVIHRDLKPSNIMLVKGEQGRDQVKVLDFGIAKIITNTAGSLASAALGTPQYASPEQLQAGKSVDRRSDIYSLGVLLYQMLTGNLPFDASSVPELIRLHTEASPPSILKMRPELPVTLGQLVSHMLAKNPGQRPQRAGDVVTILNQIILDAPRYWFCPGCNQQNQDAMRHCLKCGTMQPGGPTSKLQPPPSLKGKPSSLPWIILTICIVLIGVGLKVMNGGIDKTPTQRVVQIAPVYLPPSDSSERVSTNPENDHDKVFQSSEMLARAPRGKAIFEKLPPIYGLNSNPGLVGGCGINRTVLSLMVTEKSWNELSKDQQINLTWYIQSQIPKVRANPEEYIVLESLKKVLYACSTSSRGSFHQEASNLCSDCWKICIGNDIDETNTAHSLQFRDIVAGDPAWEAFGRRAVKASEFRK